MAQKISCTTGKDENGNIVPNHSQSLIHIEDPKYNISGNYICDVNASNFIGNLTEQINKALSGMNSNIPNIKPFSSLCLKNLDEYRAILPNYTIFPYAPSDEVEIGYDRQISAGDINKFINIQSALKRKTPSEVDQILRDKKIGFSQIPVKIGGTDYAEYMQASKQIMKDLKKSQGKAINAQDFNEAFLKVMLLVYPELAKDEQSLSITYAGVNLQNQIVNDFVRASFEENEFSIN